jgi:hypothetical protein
MTLDTLWRLAQHPNIRAIKDCGGNAGKTQQLIADGHLQVLAGEDHQIFGTVAAGGSGSIAASAHLQTAQFAQVTGLLQEGRNLGAQAVWRPLVPLITALFAEPNPAVIKKEKGIGPGRPAGKPAARTHASGKRVVLTSGHRREESDLGTVGERGTFFGHDLVEGHAQCAPVGQALGMGSTVGK